MILESVFNLFSTAIKLIFGWVSLPDLPPDVQVIIDQVFGYMESGIGFLFLFVDMNLVKVMLPMVIVVANFERVYQLVMYVLRKIPFLGLD